MNYSYELTEVSAQAGWKDGAGTVSFVSMAQKHSPSSPSSDLNRNVYSLKEVDGSLKVSTIIGDGSLPIISFAEDINVSADRLLA